MDRKILSEVHPTQRRRAGVERLLEGLPDPATEEEAAGGTSGGSSGLADSLR